MLCALTHHAVSALTMAFTIIDITEVEYKLVATFRNNEISLIVYLTNLKLLKNTTTLLYWSN